MKKYLIIIVILALLILGLVMFFNSLTGKNLIYYLTPQPERFTELYFENHQNLPSSVEAGEPYTFSFTIHNLEYATTTYPYTVYIQTNKNRIPLQKGSFKLKQNQYKTISEKFTAPVFNNRAEVIVNLDNLKQQIDFWINE